MEGYKGFKVEGGKIYCNPNSNKSFFKLGKINKLQNSRKLFFCLNGFHYCRKLKDVFSYYFFSENIFYAKIDISDTEENKMYHNFANENKSICRDFLFDRFLTAQEIIELINAKELKHKTNASCQKSRFNGYYFKNENGKSRFGWDRLNNVIFESYEEYLKTKKGDKFIVKNYSYRSGSGKYRETNNFSVAYRITG